MRWLENARLAVRRLAHRPVRSFLLLQGTIWGVAVALFPTAVVEGTRASVLERGEDVGADRITVALDPTGVDPEPLDRGDVVAVRDALGAEGVVVEAIAGVAVVVPPAATAGAPGPVPAAVLAGEPDAFVARGLRLAAGRTVDAAAAQPEAVVEGVLADELVATGAAALGATVALGDGRLARVVGVLAPRTPLQRRTNDLGFDTDHPVFRGVTGRLLVNLGVPFGDDGWKRTDRCAWVASASPTVDWLFLRVPPLSVRGAARTVERTLLARGKSSVAFYPPVYPLVLHRDLDRFANVSLALFVACLSMSAVVMAAVGLLTAMRRAPEVAVHRVEGATKGDVLAQWLVEGGVLSVAGGLLGWAVGCGLAELRIALEPMAGMTWRFPWPHAFATLAVAVVVGVGAALLPAMRAAARPPTEALVDE
ncbi:MAG: ABC transporter permease [Planctomycetes bacterium]|nr:ABC transporter permease [Planctomycetota bacterium]